MRLPRTLTPIVFVLFLLVWPALVQADFQAGAKAFTLGDYATALKEWRPLAEQGDAESQRSMGFLYDSGYGVPQDYGEAVRWYRLAANKGSVAAQHRLGLAYANGGLGSFKDYREAFFWYRLAVEQHDDRNIERTEIVLALYSLGEFYANGQGVPQDYVQAHMWYNLAAGQNVKRAAKAREDLAKEMTPEQIAEAQRLAREWLAQHQK